jgi:hypothetical protein
MESISPTGVQEGKTQLTESEILSFVFFPSNAPTWFSHSYSKLFFEYIFKLVPDIRI